MSASTTFLAPGQRYIDVNVSPWHQEQQLTILSVAQSVTGPTFVTYRSPHGVAMTTLAEALEYALAQGAIIPVTGDFTLRVS
jgi:hypothetical protein